MRVHFDALSNIYMHRLKQLRPNGPESVYSLIPSKRSFLSGLAGHVALQSRSNMLELIAFDSTFFKLYSVVVNVTLSPPSTTKVPYANSLDLDETPSNSASYPDPSCLTLRQHIHQL